MIAGLLVSQFVLVDSTHTHTTQRGAAEHRLQRVEQVGLERGPLGVREVFAWCLSADGDHSIANPTAVAAQESINLADGVRVHQSKQLKLELQQVGRRGGCRRGPDDNRHRDGVNAQVNLDEFFLLRQLADLVEDRRRLLFVAADRAANDPKRDASRPKPGKR